jgi:putative SOS response-associated peptidase YedK
MGGMCGRLTVTTPTEQLARAIGLTTVRSGLSRPRYNLAPTQDVPAVVNDGQRALELLRWGLVPVWAKDLAIGNKLINARSETAAEKPSFRTALKKRRCLVVVDGFYEWRQTAQPKLPFLIRRRDGRPLTLAGLWEEWTSRETGEVVRSCTLLTTGPNGLMAPLHDRMPVLLEPETHALWLSSEPQEPAVLQPLLVPCRDDVLELRPVSRLVNSPRNDVPECLLPEPLPLQLA